MPDTDGREGVEVSEATEGSVPAAEVAPDSLATTTEVPPEPPALLDDPVPWPWLGVAGAIVLGAIAARVAARSRRRPPVTSDDLEPLEGDPSLDERGAAEIPSPEESPGLGARLQERLQRTRTAFRSSLDALLGRDTLDDEALEALEDALLLADVGVATAERLVGAVRQRLGGQTVDGDALRDALRDEMLALLRGVQVDRVVPRPVEEGPFVLLVVGVNGSGKTTTIGKLASRWSGEGHRVILGAADTFRAAAADQLAVWAERSDCPIVQQPEGADPAAVAYETMDAALQGDRNVVLIDTAGRLQNARPLMEQLTKIRKVLSRKVAEAPHETWLVVDGTMGQNALHQARAFHEATPLTGVVVTKLDGTAKGGMVLAISQELGLPVRFIGVGEQQEDLRPFDPAAFVDALL